MDTPKNIFTYSHIVTADEIDTLNHVNNVVYVQWIQDISTKHWSDLTKNNPDLNFVWVVTRHEIDYKGQALLGDLLTFKTWVGATTGVTSVRHIEILKDGVLLVKAKTVWCMLHADTLKPARITEKILKVLQA
ncbi:thioesterase [Polaribacter pacificus]|uniref:Thioesterase n=1 Tax=Polaribacter pacificus TaxID=1775173 RepID=A0A917MDF4_9FLAO|nr:thioesterase family protein [Polaribacter pacificus]GGG98696.1 thioesterase [Polaribacter pacificus]